MTQIEIDQRVFDLYDEYCHGRIDRREFLLQAAAVTAGGLAMAQALLPRYAQAQTISFTDPAHQGALRDLSVAGRHVGHHARLPGAAERGRAVPHRAGDPREPRPQSLHRGRGAPRRDRGLPGARAGRPVAGRRLSRQRRRRPRPAGRPRPGQAAHRHGQQRALPQGARAVDGKLGVTGFCWGGGTTNFLAVDAGRRPARGRAVLRRGGRDGARARRSRRRC